MGKHTFFLTHIDLLIVFLECLYLLLKIFLGYHKDKLRELWGEIIILLPQYKLMDLQQDYWLLRKLYRLNDIIISLKCHLKVNIYTISTSYHSSFFIDFLHSCWNDFCLHQNISTLDCPPYFWKFLVSLVHVSTLDLQTRHSKQKFLGDYNILPADVLM